MPQQNWMCIGGQWGEPVEIWNQIWLPHYYRGVITDWVLLHDYSK